MEVWHLTGKMSRYEHIRGLYVNKPWADWIALLNHPDHDKVKMDKEDKRIIAMCFAEMIQGCSKEWETIRGHPRLNEILDAAFAYWESSRWDGKGPRLMCKEERILREAGFREMPASPRPKSWLLQLFNI